MGGNMEVVKDYDKDGDGRLNAEERKTARENMPQRGGRMGRGPMFGRQNTEPAKPGKQITPADVVNYPDADLYDVGVLRTFFLTFDNPEWEKELESFNNTDVEVPATLMVDGELTRMSASIFVVCLRLEWCPRVTRGLSISPWILWTKTSGCMAIRHSIFSMLMKTLHS